MLGRKFISINIKLALAIVPLILLFMGFNFLVILDHERSILQQQTEKRAISLAKTLAILSADALRTFSEYQLQQNVVQFAKDPDIVSVAILDKQNRIIAHNQSSERGKQANWPSALQASQSPFESLYYRQASKRVLEVYYPVLIEQGRHGTVEICLSMDSLESALARSQRYLTGLTLVLLSGAVVFVGFLARWFSQPLLVLAHIARKLSRGELTTRAQVRSFDEVGLLGTALNHMAARLEGMIEREKAARQELQKRVSALLEFTDRVVAGDLKGHAEAGQDDEMGRLILAVNEMVRHLRIILEDERSVRENLERSRSDLESANEKLKELDRMKSEFLNTVSHELRTPLTAIKAFAEILLDNEGENLETQVEFLGIINKEADRLTRLINNLLDLSRIEAGRMNWHFDPCDLEDLVANAYQTLRPSAEKKEVEFLVESLTQRGLPVLCDHDKMQQVLTNLIGNALKFTPSGGRVTISTRRVGDRAEVVVADTGLGIAPEFHVKIFEKFGQVDTSETREIKGSGLGLPIARSIVEAHKGTLTVDSEAGQGARFIVRIPLFGLDLNSLSERNSEGETFRKPVREVERPPQTILVVDDEPSIRRFLRHLLEQENYDVLEAGSGQEALARAEREQPDMVLLDLRLPDMTGFEILSELKRRLVTSHIPVVILSIVQDREEGFRLGAADYLTKPVDRDKLIERIEALLGQHSSLNILVVEDDPSVQKALQTILENHHYQVQAVFSAEDAQERLREWEPALILLDLMLPGLSGNDFLKELKRDPQWSELPVVVLTAADSDTRQEAQLLGAHCVVGKPFSEQELAELIRGILKGDSSQRSESQATGG